MNAIIKVLLIVAAMTVSMAAQSQEKLNFNSEKEPDELIPKPFDKKFYWGLSLPMYITTITGDNLPANYFAKPSLGFQIQAEYLPVKFVGIGLGVGFQQRGAGIINPDKIKTLGDPDSTYIERIRFNNVEFPINIILRSNDVVKGMRLSGTLNLIPVINFASNGIVHSVSDGNHLVTDVSSLYQKNDLLYQFTFGPDINTGYGLLRIHFVYFKGTKNVYDNTSSKGYNEGYGLKVTWLF